MTSNESLLQSTPCLLNIYDHFMSKLQLKTIFSVFYLFFYYFYFFHFFFIFLLNFWNSITIVSGDVNPFTNGVLIITMLGHMPVFTYEVQIESLQCMVTLIHKTELTLTLSLLQYRYISASDSLQHTHVYIDPFTTTILIYICLRLTFSLQHTHVY